MSKQECEQENCEGYLGLLGSKVVQLPVRLFLQVLPSLQPTLSLLLQDDLSFYTLFWEVRDDWKSSNLLYVCPSVSSQIINNFVTNRIQMFSFFWNWIMNPTTFRTVTGGIISGKRVSSADHALEALLLAPKLLRPRNSQAKIMRDSPQSTFRTSP